jgi:hypothetical protein
LLLDFAYACGSPLNENDQYTISINTTVSHRHWICRPSGSENAQLQKLTLRVMIGPSIKRSLSVSNDHRMTRAVPL